MFERYTEEARGVIVSSKHKASHVGSREIDTEPLLLGLLSKDQPLARRFLGSPWAADLVWRKIEQGGKIRESIKGPCDLPLSNKLSFHLSSGYVGYKFTPVFRVPSPQWLFATSHQKMPHGAPRW
jgi:hypothetical protein